MKTVKPTKPAVTFAARLRAARDRAGLSQSELALKAGVGLQTVHSLEQGRVTDPKLSTALALARALGVAVEGLAGDTPTK